MEPTSGHDCTVLTFHSPDARGDATSGAMPHPGGPEALLPALPEQRARLAASPSRRGLPAGPALEPRSCKLTEAQGDLAAWLKRWEARYPMPTDRVELHIGQTLSCNRLPRQHHMHLKSTNWLERLNEGIRRRSSVVRILPNHASWLRLVPAPCAEFHENWFEDLRFPDMSLLREQRKGLLRAAA